MIKMKPTLNNHRGTMRIDKIKPAAQPGWYKRLRQLSRLTTTRFKIKTSR
jgi:hypothetical protein